MIYQKHIFICCNQRASDQRKSCGEENGLKLVAEFKKQINDKRLPVKIRAQKCGCLDVCEKGPALVVYPEGVFYGAIKLEDVKQIVESHLVNNIPVKELRIDL
jgi:(2Fe-2S) ferredoxin